MEVKFDFIAAVIPFINLIPRESNMAEKVGKKMKCA